MANQKEINSLLELLSLQRDTLAHYLEQLAIQGEAYVLPAVKHGIKETRKEIKRLKISLRQLGVEVDDLPNDEQQANEPLGIRHKLQWTDFVSSVLMLILILWGVFTDSIGLFKIQHSIFGIVLTLTLSFIWFSSIYIHIRKIAQGNWARVPIVVIPLFVTVILAFYEIWQRSFNTYSITLITIGTLSLLFTTYKLNITDKVERNRSIRGKRDKGTKPLERPAPIIFNVRSLVFATILAATFCEILYASKLNADLANKFIILVADIDSGDNKIDDFGIAETILTKLQDNLIDISDVSIEHMNRKISANEGRLIAREEGMKRNATIVIWGWYRAPGQKAQIFVNFELLKAIGPVEKINKETCKGEEIIDINELSSFSIQTNVSDEMSYLALSTLGVARFLRDDWKVSLELFEKAQEIGKEYKAPIFDMFHSLSYLNVAQTILLETGDKDAYFKILSQGIEKGYSVSLTYYFRAGVYKTTEQLQPALDDYTKAISLNQSVPCFYNDRGNLYGALDNHVNAIIDFTQAISLSNNFDYAYFNRGREYFNDSQYDLAISDANQAVNLGLKDAYAFSGASYIEKKQINLGIDHLRKAIDNNGESVSFAYLYLGIAYEEKGEIANALNSYNEVVRINNDEQYVIAAQEAINRLKENS